MKSSRLFFVLFFALARFSIGYSQVLGDGIVGHVEGEIVLMSDVQIASFQLQGLSRPIQRGAAVHGVG